MRLSGSYSVRSKYAGDFDMRELTIALLLLTAASCTYISDADRAERRDLDGDGIQAYEAGGTDCDDANNAISTREWFVDADGDGYGDAGSEVITSCEPPDDGNSYVDNDDDCNDSSALANPDGEEQCNGLDDNCDGIPDGGASQLWYHDGDGDGFGDASDTFDSCVAPSGFIENADDCDDDDALVSPSGSEICNDIDDDCDGDIDDDDDDTQGEPSWYDDADADGYGDASTQVDLCDAPANTVTNPDDCDDANDAVKPGQPEVCNSVDDDCDGDADDADPDTTGQTNWYADADADLYGNEEDVVTACAGPADYVADPGDCDDAEALANPGLTEVCDGIDNDCDGVADESDAIDTTAFYIDGDGDGYGDATTSTSACTAPPGFADNDLDCDDAEALVNPSTPELCDGIDNDCNGDIDSDAVAVNWYADVDDDGYGDPADSVSDCAPQAGRVLVADDCLDTHAGVNPAAVEVCDTLDNDCDGDIDDADADVIGMDFYADGDDDGFGLADDIQSACIAPAGYVPDPGDCDDGDNAVYPAADELCNGIDDDCDGDVDDDDSFVVDATDWHPDVDADGFGDLDITDRSCVQPTGWIDITGDCDDDDAAILPTADEVCDGIDNNCDFSTDQGDATDAIIFYEDVDLDTYGDSSSTTLSCNVPVGYADNDTDCNDADALTNPAAIEICDSADNDCNGLVDDGALPIDWFNDTDLDGYGDPADSQSSCVQPAGYVLAGTDCNDADAAINPAADEICDGSVDEDCDGDIDDADSSVTDPSTWYADSDGDLYGDALGATAIACVQPGGFSGSSADCDDADAAIFPGATEVCDGEDNDCDGDVDDADSDVTGQPSWNRDFDGDLYGDPTATVNACIAPGGYVNDDQDCDDGDAAVSPAGTEVCNGIDDNCAGGTDEDAAIDVLTWYEDADGDLYGDLASTDIDCNQPAGFVADDTDCDDAVATTFPGAPEPCDGIDNDCDTAIDEDSVPVDWFNDTDGDLYGDPLDLISQCQSPGGAYTTQGGDCNDGDGAINPGAAEICDFGVDNDCQNGADGADPNLVGGVTFYLDSDTDTFGDPLTSQPGCISSPPAGYVTNLGDCDDTDITINPLALEVCADGVDNNCDASDTCLGFDGDYSGLTPDGAIIGVDGDERLRSITGAGDPDGDGDEDIWVGGYQADSGGNNRGAVNLFLGPFGLIDTTSAVISIDGRDDGWRFGYSVAGGIDADANGQADLFVGSQRWDEFRGDGGSVHVFMNPRTNLPTRPGDASATFRPENGGDRLGTAIDAGDFNGDGFADVLVGAPRENHYFGDSGSAYVVYGPSFADMSIAAAPVRLRGIGDRDRAGTDVANAGDTDGDGSDDIVVGAPRRFRNAPDQEAGAAYLVLGGGPGGDVDLDVAAAADFIGEADWDRAGEQVSGAGDVNGDGFDDILIGAPDHNNGRGASYLFYGPVSGAQIGLGTAAAKFTGAGGGDEASHVGAARDPNQDGFDDIVIGAIFHNAGTGFGNAGAVYFFRGGALAGNYALDADEHARFLGVQDNSRFGTITKSVGDISGDGIDDLLMSGPRLDVGINDVGGIWAFHSVGGL